MSLVGATLSEDDAQVVDIEKLFAILATLDFSKIKEKGSVLEILQRLFPKLPKQTLINIEKNVCKMLAAKDSEIKNLIAQASHPKPKRSNFFLKLSLSIAATVGGMYFGGPIAVTLSNSALNRIYTIIFGIPDPQSLTYSLLAPCQKFVTYIADRYGPYFFGATAGPIVYNTASVAEYLYARVKYIGSFVMPDRTKRQLSIASVEDLADEFQLLDMDPEPDDTFKADEIMNIKGYQVELCNNYRRKSKKSETPVVTSSAQTSEIKATMNL